MIPFVILLIVPIAMQHLDIKGIDYRKKNKAALFFFFFLLTVLLMFRHEGIGNDTGNYMHIFSKLSNYSWLEIFNDHNEFGFAFYNRIISILSKDPQFFLATTAIVTSCLIYPTYKRLCLDPSLMIVLFCTMSTFSMMFSGIRQMLAVGIGFIAYEFTRNKKLVPFIVAVCVAVTFHTSSFMLFFMYPLYHARITKKWLYAVVPAVGFVFIFNRQIFAVLSRFIERYTDYNASMESTGAYTMIILFTLFTVFAFLIPDEAMLDSETIGLRNFLLFSLVLQLFAPLHFIAMRMNYYYIIFILLKVIQASFLHPFGLQNKKISMHQ